MQITLPEKVERIISAISDAGFEAYAVGGCVRDSYLGITPNDWDIATNALPAQIKKLFRRTVDIGIKHGTVKVMIGNDGYEITTYRIDGIYEDGRHPENVTFTSDLKEDLRRRDFTINAMAYSDRDGLVDPFCGVDDLKAGIVRAVGNADERFDEDALRILRALRFSARFGYEIEKSTKLAIEKHAPDLKKISAERIREELEKLICSDNPGRLKWASDLKVTKEILPEWDALSDEKKEHTVKVLEGLAKSKDRLNDADKKILCLSALLCDTADTCNEGEEREKTAASVLTQLKYDNATIASVKKIVRYADKMPKPDYPEVRRFIIKTGIENAKNLIRLKYVRDEDTDAVKTLDEMYRNIIKNKDCLSVKDLAVGGNDLMQEGIAKGPQMGQFLSDLLDIVLDDPSMNEKEKLLAALSDKRL